MNINLYCRQHEMIYMGKRYTFAYWAAVLGTAVLVGGGATWAATSASSSAHQATAQRNTASDIAGEQKRNIEEQKKAIEAQTQAAKEAPGKADDAAKAALEKRRRIMALSGGQTLLAGETISSTKGKTLLGA